MAAPRMGRGTGTSTADFLQTLRALGQNTAAMVPAGLHGMYTLGTTGDVDKAVEDIETVQQNLGYYPSSSRAQATLEALGKGGEYLEAPFKWAGQKTLDITGSPALATAVETVPQVFAPGGAALKVVKGGTLPKAAALTRRQQGAVAPIKGAPDEVPQGMSNAEITGTSNWRAEQPVGGKPVSEMTPEELAAFGDQYGVDLRLTEPEEVVVNPATGETALIPGGLDPERPFTVSDDFWIKSQAYDPTSWDPMVQARFQDKLLAATTPDLSDPVEAFNRFMFGMQSPNTPLLPNQAQNVRMRARSMEDIDALADMVPWRPGEVVPDKVRQAADKAIGKKFGMQAGDAGGMGMRSSADLSNIAEFAKLYRENPGWFQKRPDEPWAEFAERVIAVQRGLSPKTASFGAVWQEPAKADISAMDRHMARKFRPDLMNDPETRAAIEPQRVKLWNEQVDKLGAIQKEMRRINRRLGLQPKERAKVVALVRKRQGIERLIEAAEAEGKPTKGLMKRLASAEAKIAEAKTKKKLPPDAKEEMAKLKKQRKDLPPDGATKVKTYDDILAQGGDAWDLDQVINDATKHSTVKFRLANGEINPEIPPHLRDLPIEPREVVITGPLYRRMLAANAEGARARDLSVFGEQWRQWDQIRGQVEPHEAMHRDIARLPKMSAPELKRAFDYQKKHGYGSSTGTVRPFDYRQGMMWGAGAGGLGAASLLEQLQQEDQTL